MGIMDRWFDKRGTDEDMARAKRKPVDAERVKVVAERLLRAFDNPDSFKAVLAEIDRDKSLGVQEMTEIAKALTHRADFKSRAAAVTAIGQERMRRVHGAAKAASAAKAKVW